MQSTNDLTLKEERQEGNHEHKEDADDAMVDPLEGGGEVVAARRSDELAG